jgi:uncharacterized protein (DUF924 family)
MSPESRAWDSVLRFWFGPDPSDPVAVEEKSPQWFTADSAVDAEIRRRFGDDWTAATRGELDWAAEPRGALALVILLDQFSRNLERGKAAAFAHDARALAIAERAIGAGFDRLLHPAESYFLYMPYEHSEDPTHQRRAVDLFAGLAAASEPEWAWLTDAGVRWARAHQEIIERFGRFPHRNLVMGRRSTATEERYLADGGQHFGQ